MRVAFSLCRVCCLAVLIAALGVSIPASAQASAVRESRLQATPSSIAFGDVQVGSNATVYETLTNSGRLSTITISQATIAGTGFSMSGLNPPVELSPGEQYTFGVTFTPSVIGSDKGHIALLSNAANPDLKIALTGIGVAAPVGQLSITPATIAFGNVTEGSYASQPATLTAAVGSVTVTSGVSSNSEFSLSGLSFPLTIPAGQNAQFTATFTPQANGAASGTLSFASNASNSPTIETLTGTGMAAVHVVNLTWSASESQNVIGYNIYRGPSSGGPYTRINSALNASVNYIDSLVVDGQTYFYVTTAVNSSNGESTYSNQTEAVIPSN